MHCTGIGGLNIIITWTSFANSLSDRDICGNRRRADTMYEEFFGMENTPFTRNVPAGRLYESQAVKETLGRLCYAADRQLFAVVTADPGCGKSTLIRRFYEELPKDTYIVLYLSDS